MPSDVLIKCHRSLLLMNQQMEMLKMIQVLRIPLSKDKLRALSKEERVALFLFGNVANQIVMMEKLLTFAHNDPPTNGPLEQQAVGLQGQMILRLTIGSLNEGYRAIQTRFISSPLNKTYRTLLDAGGDQA